ATATGGREGRASSSDEALDVQLSTPRELGGAGGPGTNPEQLFAAGYSACFLGALTVSSASIPKPEGIWPMPTLPVMRVSAG
ncbi:organic hydroperoxide resistance protein, partial [Stutzerimonas stutzeri]|nr:organic hydroperoxide resistance protein [Stutzerimonas stutzeri]